MLQKKMKPSCTANSSNARVRLSEGWRIQIRAAPMPIRANSRVHTTGKTQAGGDSGGFAMVSAYCCAPLRVSQPERPPTASAIKIQIAYVFHAFICHHPVYCMHRRPRYAASTGRQYM